MGRGLICDKQEARERLNALLVRLEELQEDADMIDGAIAEAKANLAEQEKLLAELEALGDG